MSNRHLLLEQWNKGLAELIVCLGQPKFAETLLEAVNRLVAFDFIMAFAYRGDETPLVLGDTLDARHHQIIANDYVSGPFLLDPFYQLVRKGHRSGCFRLHNVAPDHFRRSEYFRIHYGRTNIGEEIGFAFTIADGFTGMVSLARWTASPAISRSELAILTAIEPAVSTFCRLHWDHNVRSAAAEHAATKNFAHMGLRLLSAREREIVSMILQGHSTESVALHLDISPGTVKIHRKNIYRKLKVSTQAELFAVFLEFAGTGHAVTYSQRDISPVSNMFDAKYRK